MKIHKSDRVSRNKVSSIFNFTEFFKYYGHFQFMEFLPEIKFNDNGELALEWFGDIDNKINITFGVNGNMNITIMYDNHANPEKITINYSKVQFVKRIISKIKEIRDNNDSNHPKPKPSLTPEQREALEQSIKALYIHGANINQMTIHHEKNTDQYIRFAKEDEANINHIKTIKEMLK